MLRKYLFYIACAVLLAFIINRVHEHFFSPSALYHDCLDKSKMWEQQIRLSQEPCYVFAGGSEVRMNIEPMTMLKEHGIRAINAGVTAGHGVRCNAQVALSFLKSGDTLVLSIVPGAYDIGQGVSQEGIDLCVRRYGSACFTEGILHLFPDTFLYLFTGSAPQLSSQLLSFAKRKKNMYENESCTNISPSGRIQLLFKTQNLLQQKITHPNIHETAFTGWKELIEDLKHACDKRKANLIVYISRGCRTEALRKEYALFALYISELGIPIIKDSYLGAWADEYYYSDTWLHMTVAGGRKFSSIIAERIKKKEYWNKEELLKASQQCD